jgi:hypothetical protein
VRALLQIVEGNFDDELRADIHGVGVPRDFELQQLLRLPAKHLIRHSLECFSKHHEAATHRITRA